MLANIITATRIPLSLLLLFLSPASHLFTVLYLLCGATDILDGFVARKLHTECEAGARLDSAADLVFASVYAVKILPYLFIPPWIWIWTAGIAAVKITGILLQSTKRHRLSIRHSMANKLTGLLIFLLPLSVYWIDIKYSATVVCVTATVSAVEEIWKVHRN